MKDQEILQKAIEKAVDNGFLDDKLKREIKKIEVKCDFNYEIEITINDNCVFTYVCLEQIIFSHDFAKSFWKISDKTWRDNKLKVTGGIFGKMTKKREKGIRDYHWKNHLQQLVLEENPLEYIKQYI